MRVRSFQETLRADESVIFQQFVSVVPGPCTIAIVVRDRDAVGASRQEVVDTIPSFAGPALSTPIPVYEGAGRSRRDTVPALVSNPRATLPYGNDTLFFYVEAYNLPAGNKVAAAVLGPRGDTLWSDTLTLDPREGVARTIFRGAAGQAPGGPGAASTPGLWEPTMTCRRPSWSASLRSGW